MRKFVITLLLIGLAGSVSAKINVFTADNVVQLVRDRIGKIKTFSGTFVYVVNRTKKSWGRIVYRTPNKFAMIYYGQNAKGESYETGQKFISDGKNLWLVFKDQNIAISENLERSNTPIVGWNINRLLKEYVPTLPKVPGNNGNPTNYMVRLGKDLVYRLIFVPKSTTAGFKNITMYVSSAGDIMKVEAENQLGGFLELSVTYSEFNQPVGENTFKFEADENTQIYQNILLPDEEKGEE